MFGNIFSLNPDASQRLCILSRKLVCSMHVSLHERRDFFVLWLHGRRGRGGSGGVVIVQQGQVAYYACNAVFSQSTRIKGVGRIRTVRIPYFYCEILFWLDSFSLA